MQNLVIVVVAAERHRTALLGQGSGKRLARKIEIRLIFAHTNNLNFGAFGPGVKHPEKVRQCLGLRELACDQQSKEKRRPF